MAAVDKENASHRPSTLKSYVDRFRKGDPRSREERRADDDGAVGAEGDAVTERKDFWWLNADNVVGKTKTIAEKPYHVTDDGVEGWIASTADNNGLCVTPGKIDEVFSRPVGPERKESLPAVSFQFPAFLSPPPSVHPPTNELSNVISPTPIVPSQWQPPRERHPLVPPDRTEEQQLDDIVTRKLMYRRQNESRHPDDVVGLIPPPVRDSVASSGVGVISSRGLGSEGADSPEEDARFREADDAVIGCGGRSSSPPAHLLSAAFWKDRQKDRVRGNRNEGVVGSAISSHAQRMARCKNGGEVSRPLLPANPEDDILYQWRLRRKLQEARDGTGKRAEFMNRMERNLTPVGSREVVTGEKETAEGRDQLLNWRNQRRTAKSATLHSDSEEKNDVTLRPGDESRVADQNAPSLSLKDVATSPRTVLSGDGVTEKPRKNCDAATSPLVASPPFLNSTAAFPYPYWMHPFCPPHYAQMQFPHLGQPFIHPFSDLNRAGTVPHGPTALNVNNNNSSQNDVINDASSSRETVTTNAKEISEPPTPSTRERGRERERTCPNARKRRSHRIEAGRKSQEPTLPRNRLESISTGRGNVKGNPQFPSSNTDAHSARESGDEMSDQKENCKRSNDDGDGCRDSLPRSCRQNSSDIIADDRRDDASSRTKVNDDHCGESEDFDGGGRIRSLTDPAIEPPSPQRSLPVACASPQPDLTVVSSLSSFSSREDVSSIIDPKGADEKEVDSDVFISEEAIDADQSAAVRETPIIDSRGQEKDGVKSGSEDEDEEGGAGCNKSRPSRCEDFDSDESEFEDDEILLVLRKKRRELIQRLWMIDEFIERGERD